MARELIIGSLFSGYGGLDRGVQAALGGRVAWVSDVDKGANKILANRYPDVPNLGDISTVDWSEVEPVDVLTGGSPCQDLSHAGKRGGMTEGARSNLWVSMREAIAQLRPSLVVWENVRGAYSACADSEMGRCPRCVGDGPRHRPFLRALGRVLGDLSGLGYDARWVGLRAADVGAPHGRFRVFVVAYPEGDPGRIRNGDGGAAADPSGLRRGEGRPADARETAGRRSPVDLAGCGLFPTPRATDGTKGGPGQRGSSGDLMLPSAVTLLLPTPRAAHPQPKTSDVYSSSDSIGDVVEQNTWGAYAPAIARWEALTRPAPPPTGLDRRPVGRRGSLRPPRQLSPAFSEWMMGLPAGWVTDVPGLTRNEQLKALGNGVCPQQGEAAIRLLLSPGGSPIG